MMKIEFIIVLLLSLTICIFGFTKEESLSQWNECLREQKISKEDLRNYKRRKSPELDCFNACVMRKRGSINNNGKIDSEKMLSTLKERGLLDQTRTEELFKKCVSTANKEFNECAVARNMLDCFFVK